MAQQQLVQVQPRPGRTTSYGKWLRHFLTENGTFLLAMVLTIALWEAYSRVTGVPEYLLPAPTVIVSRMIDKTSLLMNHAMWTIMEVLLGYVIGVAIAVPLAVAITYSKLAEKTIYTFLVSSQAIPKVALAPLLIAWFGYSQTPKIVITFLICFFPVVVSTVVGLKAMPIEMFHLARSLGASGWETFWKFRLPSGLPSIFGGLKVAISLAVVGAVVGEYAAGHNGLGYLQIVMGANFDTPMVFAILLYLSVIGITLFYLIVALERWVIRWDPSRLIERAKER